MNRKQQAIEKIVNLVRYNNKLKKEINEVDDLRKKIDNINTKYDRKDAK